MGIGLGPDSYAIIEQGRIGQVLSSKPSDRRAIIEEAAGITKYKTKKRLAEAKLESSKLNLSRVNDIYVEVEKQLASLKRQASKARRYAEMREQMRGLLRQVLASKARELDAKPSDWRGCWAELRRSETQQAQVGDAMGSRAGAARPPHLRTRRRTAPESESDRTGRAGNGSRGEPHPLQPAAQRGASRAREQQFAGEREQAAAQIAQVEARVAAQDDVVAGLRAKTARLESILAEPRQPLGGTGRIDATGRSAHRRAAPPDRRTATRLSRSCTATRRRPSNRWRTTPARSSAWSSPNSNCSRNRCTIANARRPRTCAGNR